MAEKSLRATGVRRGRNLGKNAEWVDGEVAAWSDWLAPIALTTDGTFAVAWHPAAVLSSMLDDSEGLGSPSNLGVAAAGRMQLVGIDPARLAQRAAAAEPAGLRQAVESADAEAIVKALAAIPRNQVAREHVYRDLACRDRVEVAEAVARRFGEGEAALSIDCCWWLRLCLFGAGTMAEHGWRRWLRRVRPAKRDPEPGRVRRHQQETWIR